MSWTPQNPRDALSKLDMQAMGCDATRHGLLGCVIGHGNGTPEQQGRNFLYSLLNGGHMTQDEYVTWMRKLIVWEQTNSVHLPPAVIPADHPRSAPPATAPAARVVSEQDAVAAQTIKARTEETRKVLEATRHPKPATRKSRSK
jgi:hypothetical protein